MNQSPAKRPLVVITGFLGAGKTTFLKALIGQLKSRGVGASALINDFENPWVDAALVRPETAGLATVGGSCLCCGSLETFMEAVGTIKVPQRGLLLIEANGTADPMQMIEVLSLRPEAAERFWSPMQITMVDARRWGARGPLAGLEWEQLATATHFCVSRGDEVDGARFNTVRLQSALCGKRARETTPALFADELAALVTSDASAARSVRVGKKRLLSPSGQFAETSAHQHLPDGSRAFTSMTLDFGQRIWRRDLEAFLSGLPECVLRVKGLCRLADDPSTPFSFQHVRPQAETRFLALEGYNDLLVEYGIPALPMVGIIIGVRLPEAEIRSAFNALASPGDRAPVELV